MPRPKTPPPRSARSGREFAKLVEVQALLRGPRGCPWDRKQTHATLRPYLLEEAYEVLEALDDGDDGKLVSELGDLLLQVVFHAQLANEQGRFDAGDVARAVREKLVRRHPHVFGKARARNSAEVLKRWEELKAQERAGSQAPGPRSLLDGVGKNLPALSEAFQLTRRAANIGFDWKRLDGVLDKLGEEARELRRAARSRPSGRRSHARIEEETGDVLFVAANIARFLGLDPEIALRKANRKFQRRFRSMERLGHERGERLAALPAAKLERLWQHAKISERRRAARRNP